MKGLIYVQSLVSLEQAILDLVEQKISTEQNQNQNQEQNIICCRIEPITLENLQYKYIGVNLSNSLKPFDYLVSVPDLKIINNEICQGIWKKLFKIKHKYWELLCKAITEPYKYESTYRYILDIVIFDLSELAFFDYDIHVLPGTSCYEALLLAKSPYRHALDLLNSHYEDSHIVSLENLIEEMKRGNNDKYYKDLYHKAKTVYQLAKNYSKEHPLFRLLRLQTW